MNLLDLQIKPLVKCLSEHKIKYAVIGGIAVSIYGEPRFTADIDVNVILGKYTVNKFLNNVKKYGFSAASPNAIKIAKETGVLPLVFKKGKLINRVDVVIAENSLEYSGIGRSLVKRIGPTSVKVISPEDLILHKITSLRPRDAEDMRSILIRQRSRLDLKYIKFWLSKIDKANSTKLLERFNSLLYKLK